MSLDRGSEERVKLEPKPEDSEKPKAVVGSAGNIQVLVRRELKRTWPSYLSSALLNFLFGLVAIFLALTIWEAVNTGTLNGIYGLLSVLVDWFFILGLANLSANPTSTRYLEVQRDLFSEYLEFLRTLPIAPAEAVAGRAVVMLISTVAMACLFFLPLYVLAGSDLRGSLEFSTYLSFAAVWVAYGLVSGGIILYLELGLQGGRLRFRYFMAWTVILAGTVLMCNLVLDVHLVAGSLMLVERYGALPALIALAAGLAGFALLGAATVHSIKRRSIKA